VEHAVERAVRSWDTDGRAPRKVKTSERVAMAIVRSMADSGAQEGDHLPLETEMLEQYGVSRASLREGLRLLEVQGLITIKPGPNGGPLVGAADPAHLANTFTQYFHLGNHTYRELCEAQIRLESLCAAQAARHHDRRAVHMAMERFAVRGEAVPRFRQVNPLSFHESVYSLADNGVILLLARAISHVVTDHIVSGLDPVELHESIADEHRLMADAITEGRAPEAGALMAKHFQTQYDYFRRHWPARFDETIEWR
jgi:GntR family transcriptional repressor for pyruvate dehydrogenase complex